MATMLLRQAVLFGFLPTVVALTYVAGTGGNILDLGLTAVFTTALIFFIYITSRLHQANLKLLSYQTEKDDLIAELEVAKSLSDEARRRAEGDPAGALRASLFGDKGVVMVFDCLHDGRVLGLGAGVVGDDT